MRGPRWARFRSFLRQGGWLAHRGASFRRPINLTLTAGASPYITLYDIFVQAGSPTDLVDVIVTVNSGVLTTGGLQTGTGWNASSTIKLVNKGTVTGKAGNGGNGGTYTPNTNGFAGTAGSDAIILQFNMSIDNTAGSIFGGGGGGGGGGANFDGNSSYGGGGGGGGGQGDGGGAHGNGGNGLVNGFPTGGNGSNGNDGSGTGPGLGGAGGTAGTVTGASGGQGGVWGQPGNAGGNSNGTGGSGGAAGYAVRLNGHTVTWLGGNNTTQVKGAQA